MGEIMSRYVKIYSLENSIYTKGAPVLIKAGALVHDTESKRLHIQLKFESISEKQISMLKAKISLKDGVDREITTIEKQYFDLTAIKGDEFCGNIPIVIKEKSTRKIAPIVTEVCFDDGTVWSGEESVIEDLPSSEVLTDKYSETAVIEFRRRFGNTAKFVPFRHKELWVCACGTSNIEGESCSNCGANIDEMESVTEETLYNDHEYYRGKALIESTKSSKIFEGIKVLSSIQGWKDSAELVEQVREKAEELKSAEASAKKKQVKKIKIISILSATIIALIITFVTVFLPMIKRSNYLSNGQYGEIVKMDDLTTYKVPEGVTTIKAYAFEDCEDLIEVEIPEGVTTIEEGAFFGCSSLVRVRIPRTVTSIGASAFRGCSNLAYTYYAGSDDGWAEIRFADSYSNPTFYSHKLFINGKVVTSVNITTATRIRGYAFQNCDNIKTVSIGDSVESIGEGAFNGCSAITSIKLPFVGGGTSKTANRSTLFGYIFGKDYYAGAIATYQSYSSAYSSSSTFYLPSTLKSVTITGGDLFYGAFSDCDKLTTIELPESTSYIPTEAFYSCSSLIQIEIPNGAFSIEKEAFRGCSNLKDVYIPDSILSIGESAFNGCTKLENVYYMGSQSDWDSLNIGSSNSALEEATKIFGYNGIENRYTFVSNGGVGVDSIVSKYAITLPVTAKINMYFGGWYDNPQLSGTPYTGTYYHAGDITLYAKWLTEEEYCDGSSFDEAIVVQNGSLVNVTIDNAGEKVYYKFIPTESRSYTIKSTGGLDTYGYLYGSSKTQLNSHDGWSDFSMSCNLTAGNTYYIVVKLSSSYKTGSFRLSIS